jgi:hypothetical protein
VRGLEQRFESRPLLFVRPTEGVVAVLPNCTGSSKAILSSRWRIARIRGIVFGFFLLCRPLFLWQVVDHFVETMIPATLVRALGEDLVQRRSDGWTRRLLRHAMCESSLATLTSSLR